VASKHLFVLRMFRSGIDNPLPQFTAKCIRTNYKLSLTRQNLKGSTFSQQNHENLGGKFSELVLFMEQGYRSRYSDWLRGWTTKGSELRDPAKVYVTPSLMRGWFCRLQLLFVVASAVILGSESRETHDHILLLSFETVPNLEGQVPVHTSPRNGVAQLYPQALGSIFVAYCDS
jgi:hypothetical protein